MAKRMRKVWDVAPQGGGRWAVRREGSKRADSIHQTKGAAVERSVPLGTRHGGHVRIKGEDERIQDERTYPPAPRPPKV